jgi:hypothetical protein
MAAWLEKAERERVDKEFEKARARSKEIREAFLACQVERPPRLSHQAKPVSIAAAPGLTQQDAPQSLSNVSTTCVNEMPDASQVWSTAVAAGMQADASHALSAAACSGAKQDAPPEQKPADKEAASSWTDGSWSRHSSWHNTRPQSTNAWTGHTWSWWEQPSNSSKGWEQPWTKKD